MGEICSFNERNDRYKGNLLKGVDNFLGAARSLTPLNNKFYR